MKKTATAKGPLSLRTKLLIILIPVIMVYTLVITAVNSDYIMRSTEAALQKTLTETVHITAEHISESINNNKKLTELLANRVGSMYMQEIMTPYEELDVEAFARKIAQLGVDYGFLHMMVAGPDGSTMTAVHTDLRDKRPEYYTAIMEENQSCYVSDVTIDQGSFFGTYVINYSAPIRNEKGEIVAVLICKSNAQKLSDLVSNISVGQNGSTFILDKNGQCIAHKTKGFLFGGEEYQKYKNNKEYPTLNAMWDSMTVADSGYLPYDFQGERIAAYTKVSDTNHWSIAVTVSKAEFTKSAVGSRGTALLIGCGMIVFFAGLLILVFHYSLRGIRQLTNRLESLADGNLNTEIYLDRSSEEAFRLSQAAEKFTGVIQNMIRETEYLLGEIADGNLTVKPGIAYPGDFNELKLAIESNLVKLNDMVQRISRTSEEVARGSSQMASGASGLAQGASEQASSLEELFETVRTITQRSYEIGGMDKKRIADIEGEAFDREDANEAAEERIKAADTLAEKLTLAIARIAEASDDVRRIASDIGSISSETGMLALNASVEATHAGEAGRGFSVIASEIRNLSDKSRDAARDADNKIGSIARAVSRGSQTVELTVTTIGEMTLAMDQVKSALEQISNIVENIAATAEETATGSEELSVQAGLLKNMVSEFKFTDTTDEMRQ